MINFIFSILLLIAQDTFAGTIRTDSADTSTITGQITGNGVTFSSAVILVSGSSLTLRGSAGLVTTQSSVTASSFWGDGRNLTDIGILIGSQTYSGSNSFTSTFTLRSGGREISISTSASTKNINISPSGYSTFSPSLHTATFTSIPAYTTTISSLTVCVPGSTITLITGGGRVEVTFSGQITSDILATISFLQDGQFIGNLSSQAGLSSLRASIARGPTGFTYLTESLPAGSHSYCLTLADLSGLGGTVGLVGSPDSGIGRNLFYVKEIK